MFKSLGAVLRTKTIDQVAPVKKYVFLLWDLLHRLFILLYLQVVCFITTTAVDESCFSLSIQVDEIYWQWCIASRANLLVNPASSFDQKNLKILLWFYFYFSDQTSSGSENLLLTYSSRNLDKEARNWIKIWGELFGECIERSIRLNQTILNYFAQLVETKVSISASGVTHKHSGPKISFRSSSLFDSWTSPLWHKNLKWYLIPAGYALDCSIAGLLWRYSNERAK